MNVKTESQRVDLQVDDGSEMSLYVARPAQERARGGVIVLQEAYGVNAHIREVTERFAKQGYVAAAPELFHRTARHFEGDYSDFASVLPHYRAVKGASLEQDLQATFAWMTGQGGVSKVVSIGYCMGGRCSMVANAVLPLQGAVSYYGGGMVPDGLDLLRRQNSHLLMFWGGLDANIPEEHIRQITDNLKQAGKPYTNVVFSEADHAFFCDARPKFHPPSAREAWAMTLAFLENVF
jgi:carboxymethylenebutenolidase